MLLFCKLLANSCSHDHKNYLYNDIKTVYKIVKDETNYLHSIGDYTAAIRLLIQLITV